PYGQSKYVKEALIAPHYVREEEAYLDFLLRYGRSQDVKPVLFPTADPYVEFVDKYFYELKEYYLFPMDRKGFLTDLMDKTKLEQLAKDYGLRTPETLSVDEDDLYNKVMKEIGFPLIVKPADSPTFVEKYREKAFFIETERELKRVLDMTKKDGYEVFIQRIIPGPEENNYNFDAYMDQNGNFAYYTTEYKIRQWPNNFGASTYAAQKWIPEAAEFAMPFIKALNFKGFIEMEMKRDVNNGLIYLIEINVRYVNFTQMHVDIGMDTPYLTYLEMTGQDIGQKAIDYDTGYRWRYLYEDISSMRNYVRTGQMSREEIIAQNKHKPIVASTWSLYDPWPGIKFATFQIFKKLGRMMGRG
ncbi:MAG: carboxylate--amine ligase, partial [Gallicola sp.]|nr:carboxylate--amine ligase [Gallicola sp.]